MFHLLAVLLPSSEEGAGMGPFTVNFGLIFWTWLVFIALFLLLKRFAWPAILKATEEREKRIADQLSETERMNAEARETLEEHKALLAGSREQAQAILAEAKDLAGKERENILAKAREEQEQVLDRAKREIEAEKDRAVTELRKEAVDLSLAAASRLIEQRLDNDANRKLVTDYLETLGERN
jgi:F-type H+-transporting ATPase subunit b